MNKFFKIRKRQLLQKVSYIGTYDVEGKLNSKKNKTSLYGTICSLWIGNIVVASKELFYSYFFLNYV